MLTRTRMLMATMLAIALCFAGSTMRAQESTKTGNAEEAQKQVSQSPGTYRIDFTINELEDGKKINSRQYSMNLNGDDRNTLKIGTRVPVEAKAGEFQYLDVGTSIYCGLREELQGKYMNGKLSMEVKADITNFAVPDDQQHRSSMPPIRQFQINGSTIAFPGTPVIIGSVDDPNSKRRFQLEVTATKLK
jgi:hypothetical protein